MKESKTEAHAKVSVEGIIAVEEVTTTTPVSEAPQLPESVRTYHSNGQVSSAKVTWDAIDRANMHKKVTLQ